MTTEKPLSEKNKLDKAKKWAAEFAFVMGYPVCDNDNEAYLAFYHYMIDMITSERREAVCRLKKEIQSRILLLAVHVTANTDAERYELRECLRKIDEVFGGVGK